jgi:hypothetical protein
MIKLNDFEKYQILVLLKLIEERHIKANEQLPFKYTYRFKRIKDKLKLDLTEFQGKPFKEVKEVLEKTVEEYSIPTFTMEEVENLKIISDEIEMFKVLISDFES